MLFSLDVVVDVFGNRGKEPEFRKMLKQDFRKIKQVYRKERGLWKSLKLTNKRILDVFVIHCFFETVGESENRDNWKKFIRDCEIGGADFIETFM